MARSRALVLLVPFLALAAAAALAQPVVLGGSIVDRGDKPIPGARAQVFALESDYQAAKRWWTAGPELPVVAEAAADAAGRYRLELPDGGFYLLRATAPGHLARQLILTPLLDDTEVEAVKLEPSSDVALRVEGPDGAPRAGAWVGAAPPAESTAAETPWTRAPRHCRTGADGVCKLPRARGETARWLAAAPGSLEVALTSGATTATLRLSAPKTRALRLVDTRRQPVAEVYALVGDGAWPLAVSNETGELEMADVRGSVRLVPREGPPWERPLPPAGAAGSRLAIELPAAGAVEGRVLDFATRQPIAGAWVWASRRLETAVRTRPDGAYLLSGLDPSGANARAAARGYIAGFGGVATSAAGKVTRGPAIALYPAARLRGAVVDAAGRPVTGAEIVAAFDRRRAPRELTSFGFWPRDARARSDSGGRFAFPALGREMPYSLKTAAAGYAPARMDLTTAENQPEVRIVLSSGTAAHGLAVDSERRPVAGANAELRPDPSQKDRLAFLDAGAKPIAVSSDGSGRFEFPHLAAARYALVVEAPGHAPVEVPGLEVPDGQGPVDFGTVVLLVEAVVEGTVVDEAGKPVAGASVAVGSADPLARMQALFVEEDSPSAETAADGFFHVGGLRPKVPVDLIVAAAGFGETRAAGVEPRGPTDGDGRPLRIVLHPASRLTARVVERDGHPIGGADVFYSVERRAQETRSFRGGRNERVMTDDDGRFELRDLPEGTVHVTVRASGYQNGQLEVPIAPGKDALDLELVLLPGAVVVGRVTRASGAPVMGAQISVQGRDAGAATRADADGVYRLEGVEPGTRTLAAFDARGGRAVKEVEVGRAETTVDIVFPSGASVSGTVLDGEGLPIAGASLFLRGGAYALRNAAPTGGDGSFSIADVPDGEYMLLVRHEGYSAVERKVVVAGAPVSGLEVRLERGATLVGTLEGLKFSELPRAEIQAHRPGVWDLVQGSADFAGRFRLQGLAPGEWQVAAEIEAGARHAEARVTIAPGDREVPVVLKFERGLVLSGIVRRGGEPIGGAYVVVEGKDVSAGGGASSTASGAFRIEGLERGAYELTVGAPGGSVAHRQLVQLDEDRELTIDLTGARLNGRVVDAATGEPIARAALRLLNPDGGSDWQFGELRAQTDSRGLFFFDDVAPGRWRLQGEASGYAAVERSITLPEDSPSPEIELELEATAGVVLQVSAGGRPVSGGNAVVLDASGRSVWSGYFSVSDDGRARLDSVPPGRYTAWLMAFGSAPAAVGIAVPGPVVPVALEPGARVTVRVPALAEDAALAKVSLVDAGGELLRLPRAQALESEFDMRFGRAALIGVRAGPWTVTARTGDGRAWTGSVLIPPGGGEVEMELEKP